MYDDLDELLGEAPPKSPPRAEDREEMGANWGDPDKKEVRLLTVDSDLQNVVTGVSVPFLMQIFGKGKKTVDDALKGVNVVRLGKNGARYYDLAEAAEHLVAGRRDLHKFIMNMSPSDLPDQLKVEYWSAKNKQVDYEERTGELWRTAVVINFLEHMFEIIKTRAVLFPDRLDEKFGFTSAQRKIAMDLVDGMLNEITDDLNDLKKTQRTKPIRAEHDDL